MREAHVAAHLLERLVAVRVHPALHLEAQRAQVPGTVLEQRRDHLHRARARHHRLDGVEPGVHAARDRQRNPHHRRDDGEKAQAQQQLGGVGEVQRRRGLQVHGVDVRLVEAVEEHQPVGARPLQLEGEVRQRGEERRQLHRHRNVQPALHRAHQVERAPLDREAALGGVDGKVIDVELQRVGAGHLHLPRVVEPARGGDAVQGADHRDVHRFDDAAQLIQVLVRPQRKFVRPGKVGERLGRGFRVRLAGADVSGHLAGDLLLEERAHDDGGGASVLELPDLVEAVGERRGARHQRRIELESQVRSGQVHVVSYLASAAGAAPFSSCW